MIDLNALSDKELLEYKKRLEFDASKYYNIEQARKTQLNSCYGSLGNNFSRWYDIRLAEAITKSGQLVIRWLEKYINEYLNTSLKTEGVDYVIASDTDSLIIGLDRVINKYLTEDRQKDIKKTISFMSTFCDKFIQPVIERSCQDLHVYMNTPVQPLKMKCEVLADSAIWLTKKRYVMNVRVRDGVQYSTPELKIMGIEAIRSSTPTICRQKIKECLKIVLGGTEAELQKFVAAFRKDFMATKAEVIAFPRTVNGLAKYSSDTDIYIKSTPIHVKGALIYNSNIKKKGLQKKYEVIKEGEKIKFIYLKEPNLMRDSVIGFIDVIPEEFGLTNYIDYETQFDKTFLEPIIPILNIVRWKPKKEKSFASLLG